MCYMRNPAPEADASVGVRELRQNLSIYLDRVAAGTVFRVTDRGREVALLVPLPAGATTAERLVASGRAAPAMRDVLSLGRPTIRTKRSLTAALRDIRADRL